MIISLIAALTTNRVIGVNNTIPWCLPIDLRWFKRHTLNKPIIMGRRTFESIGKKPLLHRLNIVLSKNLLCDNEKIFVVNTPGGALSLVKDQYEVMVIGGSATYETFLIQSKRLYLTYINTLKYHGDVWFPDYNLVGGWRLIFSKHYKKNKSCRYDLDFKILERI